MIKIFQDDHKNETAESENMKTTKYEYGLEYRYHRIQNIELDRENESTVCFLTKLGYVHKLGTLKPVFISVYPATKYNIKMHGASLKNLKVKYFRL